MRPAPSEFVGRGSVFHPESPFVLRDSRRHRPVLPTTAESLNQKHSLLLPPDVARSRTVLDLGCCIGATGHWVLAHGASRYVGVELQAGFAQVATELLAGEAGARVLQVDSDDYLAQAAEPFDVVCALGLAHGLFDPLWTIRRAAARAREYFCFEDFGCNQPVPALIVELSTPMPIAGEQAGTVGFGWTISPQAMAQIMRFLGFEEDGFPTFIAENRWLCRYVRMRAREDLSASYTDQTRPWT
jgi:hypothetical protein